MFACQIKLNEEIARLETRGAEIRVRKAQAEGVGLGVGMSMDGISV